MSDPIEEQARCRDWLAEHGHGAGVNGIDSRMARMGASDWVAEEILEKTTLDSKDSDA